MNIIIVICVPLLYLHFTITGNLRFDKLSSVLPGRDDSVSVNCGVQINFKFATHAQGQYSRCFYFI